MVLQAHLKKHIIALGGWLLMYISGPPPGLANDHTFSGFFLLPSLIRTVEDEALLFGLRNVTSNQKYQKCQPKYEILPESS